MHKTVLWNIVYKISLADTIFHCLAFKILKENHCLILLNLGICYKCNA